MRKLILLIGAISLCVGMLYLTTTIGFSQVSKPKIIRDGQYNGVTRAVNEQLKLAKSKATADYKGKFDEHGQQRTEAKHKSKILVRGNMIRRVEAGGYTHLQVQPEAYSLENAEPKVAFETEEWFIPQFYTHIKVKAHKSEAQKMKVGIEGSKKLEVMNSYGRYLCVLENDSSGDVRMATSTSQYNELVLKGQDATIVVENTDGTIAGTIDFDTTGEFTWYPIVLP